MAMNSDSRILALLDEVLQRVGRIERDQALLRPLIERIADDVDQVDRTLRPYGDGVRLPRGRR